MRKSTLTAFSAALIMLTGCSAAAGSTEPIEPAISEETDLSVSVTETVSETLSDETEAFPEEDAADISGEIPAEPEAETESAVYEADEIEEEAVEPQKPSAEPSDPGTGADMSNELINADLDAGICTPPTIADAKGDIITISVGENYLECSVRYDKLLFLEEESTDSTLYFQAVSPGKDNIVISENSSDGVIFREYVVTISDDLTVTLIPANNYPVPYTPPYPYYDDFDSGFSYDGYESYKEYGDHDNEVMPIAY